MTATNSFFVWFYYGLGGLGGWFIFLLLALVAVIWLLYDSANRNLKALGWRMAVVIAGFLLLPAILFRFTVTNLVDVATSPLAPYAELIFYLGILGGLLPLVLAVGYYFTFQGEGGDEAPSGRQALDQEWKPPRGPKREPRPQAEDWGEKRVKAPALLLAADGHNYPLYRGSTTIGRSDRNDIQLIDDATMSKGHAKIVEHNDHYQLFDVGSSNGTYVNGRKVREPVMLEPEDEIRFGLHKTVKFVVARH